MSRAARQRLVERVDLGVERLAAATALAGGVVLLAIVALTVTTIAGRNLPGLGPVRGDFELIEMGTAFAVFASLGWCQLRRGHVTVDLLWRRTSSRTKARIDVVVDLAMTLAAALLTWRLVLGMLDRQRFNDTTFILQLPLWWGYAACVAASSVFVLCCAWSIHRSWRTAKGG